MTASPTNTTHSACLIFTSLMCVSTLWILLTIGNYLVDDSMQQSITIIVTSNQSIFPAANIIKQTESNSITKEAINSQQIQLTDIEKYKLTDFTLCDTAYKSRILMGAHHKTGTMLFLHLLLHKGINKLLRQKCDYGNNIEYHSIMSHGGWDPYHITTNYHLNSSFINSFLLKSQYIIWKLQHRWYLENQNIHTVILNIIRHPIDTILSAYNYHKKGGEHWTRISIKDIPSIPAKYDNVEAFKCSTKLFLGLMNTKRYRYLLNFKGRDYSIKVLYSKQLNLSQGIEFEYQRYVNCCFVEIYSSYNAIKTMMNNGVKINGSVLNDTLIHLWNFKTEDFVINFNKTCEILLDKIGILDSNDRMDFLNRFQRYDINNDQSYADKGKTKTHVTHGKFNKTQQIEILLSDQDRCVLLKKQTQMLDYEWTYQQFC